jgi:hypothetical protein
MLSFSSVTTKMLFNGKIVLSIGFAVKLNNTGLHFESLQKLFAPF